MNIKQAAEQSGVSARNIRYYEQAGLLTPARNPENEYRVYSQADVRALKLIRMLRTLDMPVEEIGTVLNGTLPLAEAAERQRQREKNEFSGQTAVQHVHFLVFCLCHETGFSLHEGYSIILSCGGQRRNTRETDFIIVIFPRKLYNIFV